MHKPRSTEGTRAGRPARRSGAVVALAACVVAALTSGTAAAAGSDEPLNYVALGDSYSAGSGVLPVALDSPLLCAVSTRDYPKVLAARIGATLTDATCGGATTGDFTASQYPGVAPQLDRLGQDTDLVTLTIGGNDEGTFLDAILTCATAGILSAGQGSPCKDQNGSKWSDGIEQTVYPAIRNTLAAIKERAPGARVAILGYPWIMPSTYSSGCFVKMPIAKGDVPYLRGLQSDLNDAVRRAAADTGTAYADMNGRSDGRDACTPAGTRWVEPALFGTNYVPVHPNAEGEAAMADAAGQALGVG
ncbi:SGNH/GDSL hydrolase family protein [Streptomyces sp. NPDC050560]|uniref:SGNH/GDSL hydrolase family protein n=1 Tax=Streptomyces sp. NPDC050560 TaxID=3365630 RepID=UPI00379C6C2B